MTTGKEVLSEVLKQYGIDRIYSLSGNQIMPIYDACLDRKIEIIHVRHEAAAVYMAEAEAQLTGRPAVALVTAGPGLANAVGPLLSAVGSESPIILLSGDSPTTEDGKGAFQELDQTAITAPTTKKSIRCSMVSELTTNIHEAFKTAISGRPGPVHLAIPHDILTGETPEFQPPGNFDALPQTDLQDETKSIVEAIFNANFPIIVFGPQGRNPRHKQVVQDLNELANIPSMVLESPRGLNDPSLGSIKQIMAESDLIICMGKKVDFQLGFGNTAQNASRIVVDWEQPVLEQARNNLESAPIQTVLADPFEIASEILSRIRKYGRRFEEWFEFCKVAIAKRPPEPQDDPNGAIYPHQICQVLQRVIFKHPESILISDGGEFGQWAQAYLHANRRIINGPVGAIGGGLCYALGAAAADPDSMVFSLMGDGTAGFHFMEFETAVRCELPIIVIIGNDQKWNAEYQIQLNNFGPDRIYATDLSAARYDLAAQALGAHGEYVVQLDDLEGALQRAIASGKPACINIKMQGLPAPRLD